MILEWIFVQTQKTFAGVGVGMVFVGDFFLSHTCLHSKSVLISVGTMNIVYKLNVQYLS